MKNSAEVKKVKILNTLTRVSLNLTFRCKLRSSFMNIAALMSVNMKMRYSPPM